MVSRVKKRWRVCKIGLAAIVGCAILICIAGPDLVGTRCLPRRFQGETRLLSVLDPLDTSLRHIMVH
jgi:hypothetical protein